MAYHKLSDHVRKLTNPQRSDTFVKEFKNAVREGTFDAAYLGSERFEMPKQYTRRGSDATYTRQMREMVFEPTPAYEKWFEEQNHQLAATRRGGTIKPSIETIEAGLVDFKILAQQTRQKMQASYNKGQSLGKNRAGRKSRK